MEKITDFSEISAQISRAFRPGMQSNMTLSGEDLRREVAKGTLFSEAVGSDLFIFRDMGDYFRMYFYTGGDSSPTPAGKPAVTEIACNEKSRDRADFVVKQLENAGFSPVFERERYTKAAAVSASSSLVTAADSGDIIAILRLMNTCFSHVAGCIPTSAELCEAVSAGNILCTRSDTGAVSGIIHISPGKSATELRHLAVLPEYRRKGLAQALFQAYIEKTHGKKSRVWVRVGNVPAENFYRKNGYVPDGYRSAVLMFGKDTEKWTNS